MIYPIRRKNGEVIELEADDVLSVEDILALAEEDSGAKAVNERIDRLAALVGEVASRPPPAITYQAPASPAPIVNVAAPVEWFASTFARRLELLCHEARQRRADCRLHVQGCHAG